MMGTIIGAILGFLAAVLPAVFNALAEYFEHRKDMDKGQQQIDAAKAGVQVPQGEPVPVPPPPPYVEVATAAASAPGVEEDDDDEEDLEAGHVKPLFVRAFATLRAGVRPLITYGFFIMFVFVKLYGMFHGFETDNTPAMQLLPVVWDEGAQAMFAAVLAFWFGSRAIEKQQEAKALAAGKGIVGD
jgi:hypothetical protein